MQEVNNVHNHCNFQQSTKSPKMGSPEHVQEGHQKETHKGNTRGLEGGQLSKL